VIPSPLRELLLAEGAVEGGAGAAAVALHFGDPSAEYRAVREGAGLAVRSDRARFRLHGRDPVRMLHGLITNDLQGAPEGSGVYAAMLNPKGRTVADLRAFRREGPEVLVSVAAGAREGVAAHLGKYVPPLFARWEDVTGAVAEIGVYGPEARAVVGRVLPGTELPDREDGSVEAGHGGARVLVAATREAGLEDGYDLFVEAPAAAALWSALREGARPVGFAALETLRVEAGRPRYGTELTDETIPTETFAETGLMERAISFTKGCYTGQEVIVRIAHRGHVNRHLRGLLLGDAPPPAARTALVHPQTGREVGWTTSAAVSPRLGQTVALAYVRREVEPGAAVGLGRAEGPPVTVVRLPFEGGGPAGG
jgi:folate-binding protein YgfZ